MIDFQKIKRTLEAHTCPVHHEHPTVSVSGNNVSITACCDEFQEKLAKSMDNVVLGDIDKRIDDIFKSIGN